MTTTEIPPPAPAPHPISPPTWDSVRALIIAYQGGICARVDCEAAPVTETGRPMLEVVATNDGSHAAFCRSCRLRGDGAIRAAKGAETKRARRGHRRISRADRSASTGKRSVESLLVIEAITVARRGRSMPPTAAEIGIAMLEVLRRRGYLGKDGF